MSQLRSVVFLFHVGKFGSKFVKQTSLRQFHVSTISLKDKPFVQPTAGPRKSNFEKPEPEERIVKIRTEDDAVKLKNERKERDLKKQETKQKQLEIQKKRDAEKAAKATKKSK
jgi:hypothetical protein